MTFPAYFHVLGLRIPPHPVFESAGYFVGARVYFRQRRRESALPLSLEDNLWLLAGCVFGAWFGAKLLAWAEMPQYYAALARSRPLELIGGKTIVGALLGGWIGIEFVKRGRGIGFSTGDAFVWPLALGQAIGRLGCFFTGLPDHTYGIATGLPWGVDFGDGIRRHPTQLYESLFVLLLAAGVSAACAGRDRLAPGVRFRLYLAGYFLFRFAIEFVKPRQYLLPPMSAIQLASLAGAAAALLTLRQLSWTAPTSTPS